MNHEKELPVKRGEIDEVAWSVDRLRYVLGAAMAGDAYKSAFEALGRGEIDRAEFERRFAESVASFFGNERVVVDVAKQSLIPGLRGINDVLEDALGKVVVLELAGAALKRVYLAETESIEQEFSINVNGVQKTVGKSVLSYDEIALLAWPTSAGKNVPWTMTYDRCKGPNRCGSLIPGETVKIRDGAVFNVVVT